MQVNLVQKHSSCRRELGANTGNNIFCYLTANKEQHAQALGIYLNLPQEATGLIRPCTSFLAKTLKAQCALGYNCSLLGLDPPEDPPLPQRAEMKMGAFLALLHSLDEKLGQ